MCSTPTTISNSEMEAEASTCQRVRPVKGVLWPLTSGVPAAPNFMLSAMPSLTRKGPEFSSLEQGHQICIIKQNSLVDLADRLIFWLIFIGSGAGLGVRVCCLLNGSSSTRFLRSYTLSSSACLLLRCLDLRGQLESAVYAVRCCAFLVDESIFYQMRWH